MELVTKEQYENPDGKGWVKCDKATMLKYIDFQIKFTKQSLNQLYQLRDSVIVRGMHPWGSLHIHAAPMGTGISLWDEDLHTGIEVSLATQWPEGI